MPYVLILLTLVFSSCGQKKTHALSEAGFKSSLEQKSFQTVNNSDSVYYFRGKLLNAFVEEKFPVGNDHHKIKSRDEIALAEMSPRDLSIYASKERSSAKVIVSYSDRTEIFFLPENIPLEQIAPKLDLKPEADKTFKWITTNITKTYNGAVLYLVSMNKEDLVLNDQDFYKEVYPSGTNFLNSDIKLVAGKAIEFTVTYSVLLQNEAGQQFPGRGVRCTRDLMEAGMCGSCTFTRDVPAGGYTKTSPLPLNELGFTVKIGQQVFNLNQFNPISTGESFKFEINSSVYDLRKETEVRLISNGLSGITKVNRGYNYTGVCATTADSAEIGLARRVEASVSMTVKGRGAEYLKSVL